MNFLKRLFVGVQRDFRLFIFILILLEAYRAIFIFLMSEYITNSTQISTALWAGLRLSLKTAGMVTLISFVFVTMAGLNSRLRILIGILASLIFSILFMARFPYYATFNSTFGIEILHGWNDDLWSIFVMCVQEYGLLWRLLVALVLTIICIAIFSRLMLIKIFKLPEIINSTKKFILTAGILLAVILFGWFIRFGGSFTYANGINWENSAVTQDNFLNECILDDGQALYRVYSMSKNMKTGEISGVDEKNIVAAVDFISERKDLTSNNIAQYLERTAKGARINKPKHIFIIFGETWMQWPMLGKYANLHVADGIKTIIGDRNAYYSRNFLPNSDFTSGSLCGIISGLPDLNLYLNYQQKTFDEIYITAMSTPFKKLGYKVDFWYGGTPNWDNISKMALAQGFDNFYGYPDLNAPKQTTWGAKDEYLFDVLEKHLAAEPPTVHLIMTTTNHPPYNLDLKREGYDLDKTLNEIKKLPNVPDAEKFAIEIGHYWYMDKVTTKFIREVIKDYPDSLFVVTGNHAIRVDPNTHPTIFEHQSVPFILYGAGIDKNILPQDVVGGHLSIVPTIIELIAPEDFKYHSIVPSLFESDGVGFNRDVFITANVAGQIDTDAVEILPHVASADLNNVNLTAERELADKVIGAVRTVGWWILNKGLNF